MNEMDSIGRYNRWSRIFDRKSDIKVVTFTSPSGDVCERPVFEHQPAALAYDHRGYESIVPEGEKVLAVRFTPTEIGTYAWQALRENGETTEKGSFRCTPSEHPGYVHVSPRDSRYFETTDGDWFCVIGINLCLPPSYSLSAGAEFQTIDRRGTLGLLDYRRWLQEFSQNGGNFIRIWLSTPYFEPETVVAGELDLAKFARLDGLVELARTYGVRLKLCIEHFRTIGSVQNGWSEKALKHPDDGTSPGSMDEWFTEDKWQQLWWKKVRAYVARYAGDPTVMAWELWNEINACRISEWQVLRDWTSETSDKLRLLVQNQLVVNSLGSFDRGKWQAVYDDFHIDALAFQQVHRYLDYGAELDVCYDAFQLGIDAVQRSRRPDKPVLLAETGAVNDNHTGPFNWYRADHRGIIFQDTVYPALFAGSAGIGQIWHWDEYVDKKNLWPLFRPIQVLIKGIDMPAEESKPFEVAGESVRILGIRGKTRIIGIIRSKQDDWQHLYLDNQSPIVLERVIVDLSEVTDATGLVEVCSAWDPDKPVYSDMKGGMFTVASIEISCFFSIHLSSSLR